MFKLILYSFRRCPYAIRARLALAYADVNYELREISLKNKPQAMLEISPKGTTPVLQIWDEHLSHQSFTVLEESLDIMYWALQQNDPAGWLDLARDDLPIAQQLISTNDDQFKKALDRYKYANRFPERSPLDYRQEAESFLQILEFRLAETNFLFGDRPTIADMAIFPFIRQFAYVDFEWFQTSAYVHLQKWLAGHEASNLFESVMIKMPLWQAIKPK
jgi:glutathione S-transferase